MDVCRPIKTTKFIKRIRIIHTNRVKEPRPYNEARRLNQFSRTAILFKTPKWGTDENPKENLHTTHAITKDKGKHTDIYIKPKCQTHRVKLFRGKNGTPKNKRGIQTSAVHKT